MNTQRAVGALGHYVTRQTKLWYPRDASYPHQVGWKSTPRLTLLFVTECNHCFIFAQGFQYIAIGIPNNERTFRKQSWPLQICQICEEGLSWSSNRQKWLPMLYLHNNVLFSPLRMLRSNRISCVGNDSFTGLSSVRLLSLYDNQITTIAPGAFDTLHSLSTLWVWKIVFICVLLGPLCYIYYFHW